MTFFTKCAVCRKRRFHVKQRKYNVPKVHSEPITSKNEMCYWCYIDIKNNIIPRI